MGLTDAAIQLLPDQLPLLQPDPPGPVSLGSQRSQPVGTGPGTVESGITPVDRHVRIFAPGAKTCDVCIINVASSDSEAVLQVVRSCLPRTFVTPYARLLPTQPQVGTGLISAVAVPGWITQSFRKVVVFDFSCCDGPVYAAITWDQLTLKDLADEAAGQGLKQWAVYVALSLTPVQATFRVNNGDLIRFVPLGGRPPPRPTIHEVLEDFGDWVFSAEESLRERPPSAWLVLCEDEALSVAASPDGQDLHQATAVALHRRASTLRLSAPEFLVSRAGFPRGRSCSGCRTHPAPQCAESLHVPGWASRRVRAPISGFQSWHVALPFHIQAPATAYTGRFCADCDVRVCWFRQSRDL